MSVNFPVISNTIQTHEEDVKFSDSLSKDEKSIYSDESLDLIIKSLINHDGCFHGDVLKRDNVVPENVWECYLKRLSKVEREFRASKQFNFDKTIKFFQFNIAWIKELGFMINEPFSLLLGAVSRTPIGTATYEKCPALVGALVSCGSNVNCGIQYNSIPDSSPLHSLIDGNDTQELIDQCVDILVSHGCDPNGTAYKQKEHSPLWHAASKGQPKVVRALVKAKADINLRNVFDLYGSPPTALLVSAQSSNLATVKALVELGADLFAKNGYKRTAAVLARSSDHFDRAAFLDKSVAVFIDGTRQTLLKYSIPKDLINIIFGYADFM